MKKLSIGILTVALLILSACGAAREDDTTAEDYRVAALENIQEDLDASSSYSDKTAVIYEFTTISSFTTKASYYMTPAESDENTYTSLNSYESESTYEITDEVKELSAPTSKEEVAWYLEFMIAYTVDESESNAVNRFKTAELEEVFDRSNVKVDREFEYHTVKFDYMTDLDSITSIAIKRSGKVFTLYLNGDAMRTLSLTKDIEKAYLIGYKYYIARVNEIID